MNGLERVIATLKGESKDHLAATLTLSLYGAKLTGCELFEYYNAPEKYFDGISAIKDNFDPDILFTPFVLTAEGEAFGSTVKYFNDNPPNMTKPASEVAEEIIKMEIPDIDSHPRLKYFREATRLITKNFGKENAIAGVMLSPIDFPPLIMGIDAWMDTLLFHEREAKLIIEKSSEFFVKRANAFLEDGAHFIALPVVFCNPMNLTQQIINSIAIPFLNSSFSQVKGPIVIHHGGNPMNHFLHQICNLPNTAAFVVDHKDSLQEAREILGNQKLLLGNIDGPTLNKRSVSQIEGMVKKIIEERKNDSHFILSSSSADVSYYTSPDVIKNIFDTVRSNS